MWAWPEWEDSYRADAVRIVNPRFHELPEPRAGHTSFTAGLPLRRYRPAIPATVRLLRHLPAEVESAIVSGEVTDALGPYRASGHWWEAERWGVEEWDAEIGEHGLYRLRRDHSGWCIEGCYDAELR
jgi:protein ImuB